MFRTTLALALVLLGLCLRPSARADATEDKAVAFVEKLGLAPLGQARRGTEWS